MTNYEYYLLLYILLLLILSNIGTDDGLYSTTDAYDLCLYENNHIILRCTYFISLAINDAEAVDEIKIEKSGSNACCFFGFD